MRLTLTAWGKRGLTAVWLDKRASSGYDVYAAFDAGTRRFAKNIRVQDSSATTWRNGMRTLSATRAAGWWR
jgi:hypothetical protein